MIRSVSRASEKNVSAYVCQPPGVSLRRREVLCRIDRNEVSECLMCTRDDVGELMSGLEHVHAGWR